MNGFRADNLIDACARYLRTGVDSVSCTVFARVEGFGEIEDGQLLDGKLSGGVEMVSFPTLRPKSA